VEIVRLHVSDVTTPPSHPMPNTQIPSYAYVVKSQSGSSSSIVALAPRTP
jgi:hypothetical protein